MSSVKQQDKSECLAAVGRILHQLGCLVSIKLSNSDANSNLKYQYYNLSYEGEEPLTTTVMITEENMITAEMKDEESMITAKMKDEENMITLRPGAEADVTISRVLAAISSIAPSSIYDKKRAMRKRRKRIQQFVYTKPNFCTFMSASNITILFLYLSLENIVLTQLQSL